MSDNYNDVVKCCERSCNTKRADILIVIMAIFNPTIVQPILDVYPSLEDNPNKSCGYPLFPSLDQIEDIINLVNHKIIFDKICEQLMKYFDWNEPQIKFIQEYYRNFKLGELVNVYDNTYLMDNMAHLSIPMKVFDKELNFNEHGYCTFLNILESIFPEVERGEMDFVNVMHSYMYECIQKIEYEINNDLSEFVDMCYYDTSVASLRDVMEIILNRIAILEDNIVYLTKKGIVDDLFDKYWLDELQIMEQSFYVKYNQRMSQIKWRQLLKVANIHNNNIIHNE